MDGAPLIPDQRRRRIATLLAQHEVLSVHQLTELLGVSHMTVRRDLVELERLGAAVVVPGGVRSARALRAEPTRDAKALVEGPEKSAIAASAASLIRDGAVVYLDAGTTTAAIVPLLRSRHDVTVVTNDFAIVTTLFDDPQIEVVHIGGRLDHANRSSVGGLASANLRSLALDVALISASSWELERGVTTPSSEKVEVKTAAMAAATTTALLVASSKYGSYSMYRVADLASFDVVITDDGLAESARSDLHAAGVDIQVAAPEHIADLG